MSDTERWLPVVGWEGRYEVSDMGRIRSTPTRQAGRILRTDLRSSGYPWVTFAANGRRGASSVHRAVLTAFIGHRSACPHGHPYTPENTYMAKTPDGYQHRTCRACGRRSKNAYKKRQRALALALITAGAVLVPASMAAASGGKAYVCHPVEGNGSGGNGWNLIRPDKASSHIDEATGAGKHTRKDGRTDVYAVNGLCPGQTPTPTTIPTTVTPSPTTTGGTPSASPSPSSTTPPVVTDSPSQTSSNSQEPPKQPETTRPSGTTSPSHTTGPTTPRSSVTPAFNSHSKASSTSPPSPRRSAPSTTAAPPELAFTGARSALAALGVVLLGAAGVAYGARRRIGAHR